MLQALESRFAPSYYDDPQGMLFKLWQTGTVTEYLTEFERLANHTFGLTPSCLLNFIASVDVRYIMDNKLVNCRGYCLQAFFALMIYVVLL